MCGRVTSVALCFVLLTLHPVLLQSAPALPSEGEAARLFAFAGALMEEADYYRAITEYKRFLSYFPVDDRVPLCRLNIAVAYRKGGKSDLAVGAFRDVVQRYPGADVAERAAYEIGMTQFQSGLYQSAADTFAAFLAAYGGSVRRDGARLHQGWSLVHLWQLEQAADAFEAVSAGSLHRPFAQALAGELRANVKIPRKSPFLAGALSAVIPGTGQIYTQRFTEGVTSFILNGTFIWAIVELFGHGNEVAGVLLGFFESGWYSGGIYGAVNDAHKFNRRAQRAYILSLENRYPLPTGGF